jgi:hypothetical protein
MPEQSIPWIQFIGIFMLYAIQVQPIGWLMKKLTSRWRNEIETPERERDSLASAGLWIGMLERLLIVTFVLIHEFSAIGFLIAAKSIIRFGDKDIIHPRKQSEYILIGTLLSFCFALFTTLIGMKVFAYCV